jgi:tRNA(Ser,Leu) C12 N-acetylase TAN1
MENLMSKILSNPADKVAVRNALKEISGSLTRIEAEREHIKDTIAAIADKYELPKKTFRRMAKVYHKQNFTQEQEEQQEFELLYETILTTGTSAE